MRTPSARGPVRLGRSIPIRLALGLCLVAGTGLAFFGGPPTGKSDTPGQRASRRGEGESPQTPTRSRGTPFYRHTWAVIIGIDAYRGGPTNLGQLDNGVKDAKALHDLLIQEFGYSRERICLLIKKPTRDSVKTLLKTWQKRKDIGEDDSILFFFSGHGLEHDKKGYLAFGESDARNGNAIKKTCLEVPWVTEQLGKMACRHKLIVLDCCCSGHLFDFVLEGKTPGSGDGGEEPLREFLREPAFFGLSSGGFGPVSGGSAKEGHSRFMQKLLKHMVQRAETRYPAHTFTLEQLATLVKNELAADETQQVPRWGPLSSHTGGEFLFRPQPDDRETPSERRDREKVDAFVAQGIAEADEGNDDGALPLLLRALELGLAGKAPGAVEGHQLRLVTALRNCPLVRRIWGADSPIQVTGFSQDGEHVYTQDREGGILIWDVSRNEPVSKKLGHPGPVLKTTFSPDGKSVVTACKKDGTIRFWDWQAGQISRQIEHKDIEGMEISPGGTRLVSWTGRKLYVWDAQTGKRVGEDIDHGARIRGVTFSPNGRKMATTGRDLFARLWDVDSGKAIGGLLPHNQAVDCVAFSTNNSIGFTTGASVSTQLVFTAAGEELRVWDANTGALLRTIPQLRGSLGKMRFSNNGRFLVTLNDEDEWGVTPLLGDVNEQFGLVPAGILPDRSPDGRFTLLIRSGLVYLLDNVSKDRASISFSARSFIGARLPFPRPFFSPDGKKLISPLDQHLCRDSATGRPERWSPPVEVKENLPITFSQNLKYALVADKETQKIVRVVSVPDGKAHDPINLATPVVAASFSRDGKRVMTICKGGEVEFWSAAGKRLGVAWGGFRGPPTNVAFSPVGRYAAVAITGVLHVWDVEKGQPRNVKFENCFAEPAFSPDGRYLLAASGREARILDLATNRLTGQSLPHRSRVMTLAVSPDGLTIATASANGNVSLWQSPSGKPLERPRRDPEGKPEQIAFALSTRILRLAFSGTGRYLAVTTAGNGAAAILDMVSYEWVTANLPHRDGVHWAAFSPDDTQLVTATRKGDIQVWDLRLEAVHRSFDSLKMITELLSGARLKDPDNPESDTEELSKQEILARWSDAWRKEYQESYPCDPWRERSWCRDALAEAQELGDWSAAISQCNRLIALEPGEARWRSARGIAYANLGLVTTGVVSDLERGVDDLENAIRLNPADWGTRNVLGHVYTKLGRWQDADRAYSGSIDIDSKNWQIRFNRGWTRLQLRLWKPAAEDLTEALTLARGLGIKPEFKSVVGLAELYLAICTAELGDGEGAARHFEQRASVSKLSADRQKAALAWLLAKEPGKFDAIRKELYEQLADGELDTLEDLASVAWLFALRPGAAAKWQIPVPLKRPFRPETTQDQRLRHKFEIRLLLLRRAEADRSKEKLKKAFALLKEFAAEAPKDACEGYVQAAFAIANRALGHREEAEKCVRAAKDWMKQREKNGKPLSWQERLELQFLLP